MLVRYILYKVIKDIIPSCAVYFNDLIALEKFYIFVGNKQKEVGKGNDDES